jgi:adenylosuccinate synthase
MINGVSDLMMMKSDVLSGFDTIQLCTSYQNNGAVCAEWPMELSDISPIYSSLPGWNQDLTSFTEASQIPEELKAYIQYIESFTATPINLVSVGPGREQTLFL